VAEATPAASAAGKLRLVLVTHDRKLLDLECDEVTLPGKLGYFGVLPGHTPLLAVLRVGELMYRIGKREHYLALSWGFCEVANDTVTVLAEFAQLPEEIDVARAEQEAREAEDSMRTAALDELDEARARLESAVTRIQVARRPRG
jgi:F-type H+-transporting ATPase subunit epsilon